MALIFAILLALVSSTVTPSCAGGDNTGGPSGGVCPPAPALMQTLDNTGGPSGR